MNFCYASTTNAKLIPEIDFHPLNFKIGSRTLSLRSLNLTSFGEKQGLEFLSLRVNKTSKSSFVTDPTTMSVWLCHVDVSTQIFGQKIPTGFFISRKQLAFLRLAPLTMHTVGHAFVLCVASFFFLYTTYKGISTLLDSIVED